MTDQDTNYTGLIGAMLESEKADLEMSYGYDRLAARAVFRWAIENHALVKAGEVKVRATSDNGGCFWGYDQHSPGNRTAYPDRGNFIRINSNRYGRFYIKISREEGEWFFHEYQRKITPYQFLTGPMERHFGVRASDLLFNEFQKSQRPYPRKWLGLGCLEKAQSMSPSAAIIPFKILMRDDPSEEIIELARLLRAVQWLADKTKTNDEKKDN